MDLPQWTDQRWIGTNGEERGDISGNVFVIVLVEPVIVGSHPL